MKVPIYEKLIPKSIRLQWLKNKIVKYLGDRVLNDEQREVYEYLQNHKLSVFPYSFPQKYISNDIFIETDPENGLYYTLWEGKKLYYKNGHQFNKAQVYFNSLLLEQDPLSPHRYLTDTFDVDINDVIVDVGAAEGNFSLSVIEKVKQVYIFEVEKDWIKALEATFEPWKEKVKIVQKYVSDQDTNMSIRLDTFFNKNQKVNFIKADVEGAEAQVINGASDLIKAQSNLKIAICTYHRQTDAEDLDKLLKNKGFENNFSDKYMIFYYGKTNIVKPPYLRKAVLRATKV
ncbi:FkbM family methyltransferase [Lacihabitans sp. CCS-44]|uniref:FkbM family methyltransferase n=1 Tax=Lacihabitans sp. CCS-44 TaxID=2487331 RepID=UPI0020CE553E|nr:FkbM family methyltransferase [Lacihabitans sp. CCS-44]MCP9757529.1 FkbM family methyltransferase [Lacihabitans sp. CCS-44]